MGNSIGSNRMLACVDRKRGTPLAVTVEADERVRWGERLLSPDKPGGVT